MKLNKGSLTVEAVILLPLILFLTVFSIYIGLIQYDTAVVYREAEYASVNIALYDNPNYTMNDIYDIEFNKNYGNYSLYWQLFNNIDRLTHEDQIVKDLNERLILPCDVNVTVTVEGFLMNREIVVDIDLKYHTPIDNFIQNMGLGSVTSKNVVSKHTIRNSSEFIRNYDMFSNFVFSRDTVKKLTVDAGEKVGEISGVFDSGVETSKETIQKIINLLKGTENGGK